MSELFSHYKPSWTDEVGFRWVIFDIEMPDEVLRGLMSPVEPFEIEREPERGFVTFYSTNLFKYDLLDKVRAWEKEFGEPLRAEKEAIAAAERQARFEEYYRSLNSKTSKARKYWLKADNN